MNFAALADNNPTRRSRGVCGSKQKRGHLSGRKNKEEINHSRKQTIMCEKNSKVKMTNIVTGQEKNSPQIENESRSGGKMSKTGNGSRLSTKKRRNRKTSKPKRRYENIETDTARSTGQREKSSLEQKHFQNQPKSQNQTRLKAVDLSTKQAAPTKNYESRDISVPLPFIEVQNSKGDNIENQELSGIKQETFQGFVVDQWCDLGPSVHAEGHSPHGVDCSPLCLPYGESEGLLIKQSPISKRETQLLTKTQSIRSSPDVLDIDCHLEYYTPGQFKTSARGERLKRETDTDEDERKDKRLKAEESENKISTSGLKKSNQKSLPLQTDLHSPFSENTQSLNVHVNPFPMALFSAEALRFPLQTCGLEVGTPILGNDATFSTQNMISVNPGLDKKKEDLKVQERGNKGEDLYTSKAPTAIFDPAIYSALSSVSSQSFPLVSENISTSYNVFTNAATHSGIGLPGVVYQDNFFQHAALHHHGMMFLSPSPCFVQQVPYLSLLPNLNYPQIQTNLNLPSFYPDVSIEQNGACTTDIDSISNSGQETSEKKKHIEKSSTEKSNETDRCDTNNTPRSRVIHQPLRQTLKPKMTGGADFIDPTTIKFGVDDDGETDEDTATMSCNSDTSDEEWHPSKTERKFGNGRGESGDVIEGWEGRLSAMEDEEADDSDSPRRKDGKRRGRPLKHPVKCGECGKVFQGKYYLRRHQMSHSEIRPYRCQVCDKSFKQKAHLHGHRSVHDKSLKQTKKKGQKRKLKVETDASRCPGRPRKTYSEKDLSCKQCGKSFKTVYRRKRHEQSHTDLRPFTCRICGKGFKQTGHRNEHETNHEKTKKRFLCSTCGVVFRCRSSFTNHMRSHSVEKLRLQQSKDNDLNDGSEFRQGSGEISHTGYDCPYCSDKFATAQALNSHLETHVEVRQRRHVQPYSCDVCRRAFTYRHNLLKHKLLHKAPDKYAHFYKEKIEAHVASGKPSFRCFVCSKVFIRKETLAKHFKIHSGNKPYKCSICHRDFTQNVHLKVHMRKHTGSRPFQCNECSKGFIDSTALAKHIEYEACNSDNSLYHCKICDKRHYYLGSIKLHIRKEHGVDEDQIEAHMVKSERTRKRKSPADAEKHGCKICSWKFTEKCNLVRHVKRKHSELLNLLKEERSISDAMTSNELENSKKDTKRLRIIKSLPNTSENITMKTPIPVTGPNTINFDSDESSKNLFIDECTLEETSVSFSYRLDARTQSDLKTPKGQFNFILREHSRQHDEQASLAKESSFSIGKGQHITPIAEDCEEVGPVTDIEEDSRGGLLDGFQRVKFTTIENHNAQDVTADTDTFLSCRETCFSTAGQLRKMSSESEDAFNRNEEKIAVPKKECTDEEVSSPTDINFLYNIGLIVSNRAKKLKSAGCKASESSNDLDLNGNVTTNEVNNMESHSTCSIDRKGNVLSDEGFLPYFSHCQELETTNKAHTSSSERFRGSDDGLTDKKKPEDGLQTIRPKTICERNTEQKNSSDPSTASRHKVIQNIPNVNLIMKSMDNQFACSNLQKSTETSTLGQAEREKGHDDPNRSPSKTSTITNLPIERPISTQGLGSLGIKIQQTCDDGTTFQQTEVNRDTNERQGSPTKTASRLQSTSQDLYISPSSKELETMTKQGRLFIERESFPSSESSSTMRLPIKTKDSSTQLSLNQELTMSSHSKSLINPRQLKFDISDSCHLLETTHLSSDSFDHDIEKSFSQNEPFFPLEVGKPKKYFLGAEKPRPVTVTLDNLQSSDNQNSGTKCITNKASHSSNIVFSHKNTDLSALSNEDLRDNSSFYSIVDSSSNQSTTNESVRDSTATVIQSHQFQSKYPDPDSKSVDDFESCPTESHLKYLGLLACRDSKELENKSFPLKTLYATFKPWLENLVFTTRSNRVRKTTNRAASAKIVKIAKTSVEPDHDLIAPKITDDSDENKTDYDIFPPNSEKVNFLGSTSRTPNNISESEQVPRKPSRENNEPIIFKRKRLPRKKVEIQKGNNEIIYNQAKDNQCHAKQESACNAQTFDGSVCSTSDSISAKGVSHDKKAGERMLPSESLPSQPPPQSYLDAFIAASALASSRDEKELVKPKQLILSGPMASATPHFSATISATASSSPSPFKVSLPGLPAHAGIDCTERGRNQFPCAVCGKVFTARHQLKRHEMTHTDNRPFKCEKCGRAFRQKVHLSDHIKRHQGQRPFECQGCGKKFVLKNEMNQHVKNHCKGSANAIVHSATASGAKNHALSISNVPHCMTQSDPACAKPNQKTPLARQTGDTEELTSHGWGYKPGDVISNGTITLRVVDSAVEQKAEKPGAEKPNLEAVSSKSAFSPLGLIPTSNDTS